MMRFGGRGGWQGALDEARPGRPVFPYQRAFAGLVQSLHTVDSFLSIGVGTGTALNSVLAGHPNAQLYGVEIDQTVLEVAIRYFHAPDHRRADYYVGDGFAFIRADMPISYDLIFVDAYMRNDIYQPALDPNVLDALRQRLRPQGVVAYNIIGPNLATGARGTFVRAAKSRFASVLDLPVGVPFSDQNRLVMLTDHRLLLKDLCRSLGQASVLKWHERLLWPSRLRSL
ncbi:spermidine synthase [Alicyclobacillus fastidiosus]|uniref:Spermidine synthase n=1 Tax=Alicyclobacillus fastidiosus TaxID=392011 RepID=A0ABV5AH81_9BACL|nr:spermidine synthase [Alicyclobacillus fastidiosus]WEH11770.1 spermidine synthase [Alicyclobacillus fastidiosus]